MPNVPKQPNPAAEPEKIGGVEPELWQAAHAPSISEHAAGRFFLWWNGGLVRFAFGQAGYPLDDKGAYAPTRFEVAISMAPALAVELRNTLDKLIQQSQAQQAAAAASPKPA